MSLVANIPKLSQTSNRRRLVLHPGRGEGEERGVEFFLRALEVDLGLAGAVRIRDEVESR